MKFYTKKVVQGFNGTIRERIELKRREPMKCIPTNTQTIWLAESTRWGSVSQDIYVNERHFLLYDFLAKYNFFFKTNFKYFIFADSKHIPAVYGLIHEPYV